MDNELLRTKFIGAMMGSALGDAIGELFISLRSKSRVMEELEWTHKLRYTDDTAMAMGIAESLMELGKLDPEHLGDTFRKNYKKERNKKM